MLVPDIEVCRLTSVGITRRQSKFSRSYPILPYIETRNSAHFIEFVSDSGPFLGMDRTERSMEIMSSNLGTERRGIPWHSNNSGHHSSASRHVGSDATGSCIVAL